ncbi:MAG: hypothetical protein DRN55_03900 [Thermoplasmata archaeon]|nr:MAG: hypothetical protein DRN55_03900 [Thermoplasmata archaeon]
MYREMRRDVESIFLSKGRLLNYLPGGKADMLRLLEYTVEEALLQGRKLVILSPRMFQREIRDIAREKAAEDGRSVVHLPSTHLPCPLINREIKIADVVNHCLSAGQCAYQKDFDLEIFRDILSGKREFSSSRQLLSERGMCPSRMVIDLAAEGFIIVSDYPFIFHQGWRRLIEEISTGPEKMVILMIEPYELLRGIDEEFTFTIHREDLSEEYLEALGGVEGVEEGGMRILKGIVESLRSVLEEASSEEGALPLGRGGRWGPYGELKIVERHRLIERLSGELNVNPEGVVSSMRRLLDLTFPDPSVRWWYANLYLFVKFWIEGYDAAVRFYVREEGRDGMRVTLLNPASVVREVLDEVGGVIISSTGSYPTWAYSELMGLKGDDYHLKIYYAPEGEEDSVRVFIHTGLTFLHRRDEGKWAAALETAREVLKEFLERYGRKEGIYAVIFPSFHRKEEILEGFQPPGDVTILSEPREKSEAWWERLQEARDKGEGVLLMVGFSSTWNQMVAEEVPLRGALVFDIPMRPGPVLEYRVKYLRERYGWERGSFMGGFLHAFYMINSVISHNLLSSERAFLLLADRRYSTPWVRSALPSFLRSISSSDPYPMIDDFLL